MNLHASPGLVCFTVSMILVLGLHSNILELLPASLCAGDLELNNPQLQLKTNLLHSS